MMSRMDSNPFAVLTAVVAPAILTNACSVLALGTSNRLARVVDRTRFIADRLASHRTDDPACAAWRTQMERQQARGHTILRALRLIYAALGLFAGEVLVSVVGSTAVFYERRVMFEVAGAIALVIGICAVSCLSTACWLMVKETRLAVENMEEEARLQR